MLQTELLSTMLPGYVGADIAALCRGAAICALRRFRASSGSTEL
jgi:SpoVK/Ycf46/Vps4 family AAA+-type ATPase